VLQIVDALIMFDDPVLDRRFQEAIAMHPDAKIRAALAALPARVAEGSRITRRAGVEWERATGGSALTDDFQRQAERFLLQALLDGAEAQIRLKTFMARHAPTQPVRALIDEAVAIHRELADALRDALAALEATPGPYAEKHAPPYVGERGEAGDLRGQVEAAIRDMSARGKRPRVLVVSANAMRHLRDQGVLMDSPTLLDVAVQVDFSWSGSTFALLSYESAPLDEILSQKSGAQP